MSEVPQDNQGPTDSPEHRASVVRLGVPDPTELQESVDPRVPPADPVPMGLRVSVVCLELTGGLDHLDPRAKQDSAEKLGSRAGLDPTDNLDLTGNLDSLEIVVHLACLVLLVR